jgi:hypothetical protein
MSTDFTADYLFSFLPAGFVYEPEVIVAQNATVLGMGSLFASQPTIKNPNGTARTFAPFYSFSSAIAWQADGALVTHLGHIDYRMAGRTEAINSGSMTMPIWYGTQVDGNVGTDTTVNDRVGHAVGTHVSGSGTLESLTGFATANYTRGATANIDLSMGDITPFANGVTGNWGVYQSHQKPNRFNGSVRYPSRTVTTNTTLNDTDYFVVVTGAGGITITLPTLSANRVGMEIVVKNLSSGNVTVSRGSTDTIDLLGTTVTLTGFGSWGEFNAFSTSQWASRS